MKATRKYAYTGASLFVLYFFQEIFHIKHQWLERWQRQPDYRLATGILLAGYILLLWQLSITRMKGEMKKASASYKWHQRLGALTPLVFFIHSTRMGSAYIFFLSSVFFGNVLVGILNQETLGFHKRWFYQGWMVLHVTLSVLVVFIGIYHIYIVFTYH